MAKNPDPNMELEDYNPDLDPFAEGAGASDAAAGDGDPFDFNPNPPAFKSAKKEAAPGAPPSFAGASAPGAPPAKADRRAVGLTADVPVQLVAVMGKKTITIKEILSLKKGQVIELNRFPNEAIDLVANGKLMAKGELVEIDGKLGVRIIKIFE